MLPIFIGVIIETILKKAHREQNLPVCLFWGSWNSIIKLETVYLGPFETINKKLCLNVDTKHPRNLLIDPLYLLRPILIISSNLANRISIMLLTDTHHSFTKTMKIETILYGDGENIHPNTWTGQAMERMERMKVWKCCVWIAYEEIS